MTESPDPVERSDAFDKKIERIGVPSLESLGQDFKRLRRMGHWLFVSITIQLLLIASIGYLAVRADSISHNVERNQTALQTSCQVGNQTRATERELWDHILNIPPIGPQSQEQKDQVAQFKVFLNTNLAPRDCSKIG